jgi:hypothetical protein
MNYVVQLYGKLPFTNTNTGREKRIQTEIFSSLHLYTAWRWLNVDDTGSLEWFLVINLLKPSGNFTYHQV